MRLHPLPAARRVVTVRTSDPAAAFTAAAAVTGSQLVPSAVEVDQQGTEPGTVTVLLEGIEAGVDSRAQAATELLTAYGSVDTAVTTDLPDGFADLPFADGGTGLKVTSSMTGVADVLATARALSGRTPLRVRGSAAGVLHVGVPAGTEPAEVAAVVERLRATAAGVGRQRHRADRAAAGARRRGRVGTGARPGPDAPAQGRDGPRPPAVAGPLRGRDLMTTE